MLKIFVSLIAAFLSLQTVWAGKAEGLEEAKAIAARTGKPILMDFMTEW